MKDDTYNGWSNYETWNWKLWLDNDQGAYEYWANRVQELNAIHFVPDYEWETESDIRIMELANELEDDCIAALQIPEDSMELLPTAGPFADILNAGIGRINWREIAENMLSE